MERTNEIIVGTIRTVTKNTLEIEEGTTKFEIGNDEVGHAPHDVSGINMFPEWKVICY